MNMKFNYLSMTVDIDITYINYDSQNNIYFNNKGTIIRRVDNEKMTLEKTTIYMAMGQTIHYQWKRNKKNIEK